MKVTPFSFYIHVECNAIKDFFICCFCYVYTLIPRYYEPPFNGFRGQPTQFESPAGKALVH